MVSGEYRKYPSARFPDFLTDGAKTVAWTVKNISGFGKADNIYVGGSSAGGYISMMLCFCSRYLENEGLSNRDIAGYFHDAGQPTSHFNVLREKNIDTRKVIIDDTAPIYFIDDRQTYPPMEIVISDNDMENRYEQTMLLYSTLKHFGHDMSKIKLNIRKNSSHCSYVYMKDENGQSVFADMIYRFIENNRN